MIPDAALLRPIEPGLAGWVDAGSRSDEVADSETKIGLVDARAQTGREANPQAYIASVIESYPQSQIDRRMPWNPRGGFGTLTS